MGAQASSQRRKSLASTSTNAPPPSPIGDMRRVQPRSTDTVQPKAARGTQRISEGQSRGENGYGRSAQPEAGVRASEAVRPIYFDAQCPGLGRGDLVHIYRNSHLTLSPFVSRCYQAGAHPSHRQPSQSAKMTQPATVPCQVSPSYPIHRIAQSRWLNSM